MSELTSAPAPARAHWTLLAAFCAIWSGLVLTEFITDSILPLTLARFLENAGYIGMILATKPLFGFLAQPLIGIWSDHIWTPLGRRALFLLVCAPIVALCLWLVPQLTMLWTLVVVVVAYQFFQDVSWGSDHPLMADLVPVHLRTFLMGLIMTTSQILGFLFLKFGMGVLLPRYGEIALYRIAATAQILLVMAGALALKESPPVPKTRPKLTLGRYFRDFLGDPILRKFALLAFFQGLSKFVVLGYIVLFAVKTAGIAQADFGASWSWFSVAALCTALPAGVLVERIWPKQISLVIGYTSVFAGCVWGLFSHAPWEIAGIGAILGFGHSLIEITQKPFFTEYLPKDIIGQLSGAYNVCFATGRTLAMVGGGWLIQLCGNNYRLIWVVALVTGVVTLIVAASIPDHRYSARKQAGLSPST